MNYVNAYGEPISIGSRQSHVAKSKPKADAPAEFHRGWRVQGHPPGAMEQACAEANRLLDMWNAQTEQEKAEAIRSGDRQPPAWDERLWRTGTKKKPVRSKPYEVPEAARLCADMARKAGWLDIEVAELKRSKTGA